MPVFYLDDEPIEFEKGDKILSAVLRAGIEIPHYCYHPALSIVATCRMCLVDIVDMGNGRAAPKLMTSCSTDAAEGMKVVTKNKKVQDGRELVMEFLLINHPLDCPICDQAGECTLQDFSHSYGSGASEMEYSKRVYGWRDVGTFVTLERNRCIHCTRCERFTKEVTGTREFGMFNRSHQLTVDTFADRPMTNKFQGNMADICPVGCITEKEFRFKKRVWRLKKTKSICTSCSTGCNINVEEHQNTVYRLKPRENHKVNQWWMCDEGRVNYRYFNEKRKRVTQPMARVKGQLLKVSWEDIYGALRDRIQELSPPSSEVLALTDTHSSNEELFLVDRFMKSVFESDNTFFPLRSWTHPETEYSIDSLITTDKSPNQAGAIALGLRGDETDNDLKAVLQKGAKIIFILGKPFEKQDKIAEMVTKADLVIYIGTTMNHWAEKADVVLPGQTHVEKSGSFINKNNIVQRINPALKPPEMTKPEWLILTELIQLMGYSAEFKSIHEIFDTIGLENSVFRGLTYDKIGDLGKQLEGAGA